MRPAPRSQADTKQVDDVGRAGCVTHDSRDVGACNDVGVVTHERDVNGFHCWICHGHSSLLVRVRVDLVVLDLERIVDRAILDVAVE